MINKKIKETLDRVLPTEAEKNKMLQNILKQKTMKQSYSKLFAMWAPAIAVIILCLTLYKPEPTPNVALFKTTNIAPNTIEYLGKCYQENGIYEGTDLIGIDIEFIEGTKTFRVKDNNIIVIKKDNVYLKYEICKKEGN